MKLYSPKIIRIIAVATGVVYLFGSALLFALSYWVPRIAKYSLREIALWPLLAICECYLLCGLIYFILSFQRANNDKGGEKKRL
jgi:hypothetical protein